MRIPARRASIAGQGWYEKILDRRMRELPADSTIVAIGSYAYDWVNGGQANPLGFHDAMGAARDAGATVKFDEATNNPHFEYREGDGTTHDIWLLDAATAFNQIHAADQYRPAGYALWRLGFEDPTVLPLMGQRYNLPVPANLKYIAADTENVDLDGTEGEILRVEANPQPGFRDLQIEQGTGDIIDEHYKSLPTGFVIHRVGQVGEKAGAHLRRRSRSGMDAPDSGHPQSQACAGQLLRHRLQHGGASGAGAANPGRGP